MNCKRKFFICVVSSVLHNRTLTAETLTQPAPSRSSRSPASRTSNSYKFSIHTTVGAINTFNEKRIFSDSFNTDFKYLYLRQKLIFYRDSHYANSKCGTKINKFFFVYLNTFVKFSQIFAFFQQLRLWWQQNIFIICFHILQGLYIIQQNRRFHMGFQGNNFKKIGPEVEKP